MTRAVRRELVLHGPYSYVSRSYVWHNMTRSYVWHDLCSDCHMPNSLICVTWLIPCDNSSCQLMLQEPYSYVTRTYVWHDQTHSYVWRDSCSATTARAARNRIHMDSFICVIWHDSLICVTWPTHMCDWTHLYVWHDSCSATTARAARTRPCIRRILKLARLPRCVCVWGREREFVCERERECVCVCCVNVISGVCQKTGSAAKVCVRECVCVRERESVCVCVCVRERERVCVCVVWMLYQA